MRPCVRTCEFADACCDDPDQSAALVTRLPALWRKHELASCTFVFACSLLKWPFAHGWRRGVLRAREICVFVHRPPRFERRV